MHLSSTFAIACSFFLPATEALRRSGDRADREPWDLEDTFDLADDRSRRQVQSGHKVSVPAAPIGTTGRVVSGSVPTAAGAPVCASQSSGQRVVSVADLHGDFTAMAKHLYLLGLLSHVPSQDPTTWSGSWAGGDTIFVQTGDILDRGPDGKAMYKFLWALQDDAPQGHVILMTGNHELMVLQGDLRYVTNIDFCTYTSDNCGGNPPSSGEYCSTCCGYDDGQCSSGGSACLEGNCEFLEAWDINGEMGAELRRRFVEGKMKLSYKINGVAFTHAGLTSSIWPKIESSGGEDPIDRLNNITAALFASSSGEDLRSSDSIIAAGTGQNGPMWTRVCYEDWYDRPGRRRRNGDNLPYYMDADELQRVEASRCETIRKSLEEMSATRMVIGHCPQTAIVKTSCGGAFVETDTYMSIAYAGTRGEADYNMAALEFYSEDPQQKVWAVYSGQNACQQLEDVYAGPPTPAPVSVRRRRRNADLWTCRRRSSDTSDSEYGDTPDGYVCSGDSIVPE